MKARDWLEIAIIVLIIAVLMKHWTVERVTSRFYPGELGQPPPWRGKIGDVVEWGGCTWAWTPAIDGWAKIGECFLGVDEFMGV